MPMNTATQPETIRWQLWQKIVFRFFFIYILLQTAPWTWLDSIPGVTTVTGYYTQFNDWAVNACNALFFHVRDVLVPMNGSGDTSYGWAELWLYLCVAFLGCAIWSVADRKRLNYTHLNYWLCLFTRYFIAFIAFVYGIEKLFAQQMLYPNLSQLATPLGDFLPMRLSWMFIGYSTPYQIFSGCMETFVGILLLYRRTATLGILMGTAVFLNVMMLNLCYDIPVKIFSINLVLLCIFLLANEWNRIVCFFILNKPAASCTIYHFHYTKKWMRIARWVLKILFIILVLMQFPSNWNYHTSLFTDNKIVPFKKGMYDVAVFAKNKDTIPFSINDSLRWQDVIFDKGGSGSIKTCDAVFRQRYKRGYFYYDVDTVKKNIGFKKMQDDSIFILTFRYDLPDTNTIMLWGMQGKDSLYVELKKSNHHFQLSENQFHWLSESNR